MLTLLVANYHALTGCYRSVSDDIYDVLMTMKSDMNKNNDRIITYLKQVHSKIDNISDTVRELRVDDESIRRENSQFKIQISDL
jgi:argininosuccinate lyase